MLTVIIGFTSPGGGVAGGVNNGVYTTRSSTAPVWPQSAQFTPDPGISTVTLPFLATLRLASAALSCSCYLLLGDYSVLTFNSTSVYPPSVQSRWCHWHDAVLTVYSRLCLLVFFELGTRRCNCYLLSCPVIHPLLGFALFLIVTYIHMYINKFIEHQKSWNESEVLAQND